MVVYRTAVQYKQVTSAGIKRLLISLAKFVCRCLVIDIRVRFFDALPFLDTIVQNGQGLSDTVIRLLSISGVKPNR